MKLQTNGQISNPMRADCNIKSKTEKVRLGKNTLFHFITSDNNTVILFHSSYFYNIPKDKCWAKEMSNLLIL